MDQQSADQPMWRPVSVQDTMEFSPIAGNQRMKRINFVLADGTQSYVTVPLTDFTDEIVANAIHQAALAHAAVMSQQGPPMSSPNLTLPPTIRQRG